MLALWIDCCRTEAARHGGYSATFDVATYFLRDVPPEIIVQGEPHERSEANVVFTEPCRFKTWPEVPIPAIAGLDDRFFPLDFQRRVVEENPTPKQIARPGPDTAKGPTVATARLLVDLGLDEFCQLSEALLPAEVARLGWDDVGNAFLFDGHLRADRDRLQRHRDLHLSG